MSVMRYAKGCGDFRISEFISDYDLIKLELK